MEHFQLTINEQRSVTGIRFIAAAADKILIIVPATGVLQSFYFKLATFLQQNGITVITFDYAGIGKSLNGSIKHQTGTLKDWGSSDLEAVIHHTLANYPGQKLILLGHSIGGQLIGLAASSVMAEKIILISSQSGYWKFWKGIHRIRMWLIWYLLVPVFTRLYGYLPAKKISRMQHLPARVALDWAKWCRSPNYLFDNIDAENLHFGKIKCKLTSISISDDLLAPAQSVDWLTEKYVHARLKKLHFLPEETGVSAIGHFSLFTEKFRDSSWKILLQEVKN
jgi:predicted alpha/beta hydrolase